jgi:hypothetical protein
MTKESKEAVIEHGIDEAFNKLSGVHLQSLGTVWDLCKSDTTSTLTPTSEGATTAVAPTATTPEPLNKIAPSEGSAFEGFDGLSCTTASNPQPTFINPVIALELIDGTMPPGLASTGMLKPHGYFFVKHDGSWSEEGWSGYPRTVPVYAPVTSWLRQVYPYTSGAYGEDVPEPPIEYMLIFEVSCEVYYKLDHLGPLSETIEASGPFPINESTILDKPLQVEAGELVSYWSGVNPGGNVDLGVYNTTIERTFVNQSRYSDGYHDAWFNEDCPFDYFPEELRAKYYGMFTDVNSGEPIGARPCRTSAESDVPGTIKGAWFKPGEYGSVFSVSTSFSGWVLATFSKHAETGASFEIKVTPENITYLEPSKVTSEHCYQSYAQDGQEKDAVYVNLESY